jgi:hypothetical protein
MTNCRCSSRHCRSRCYWNPFVGDAAGCDHLAFADFYVCESHEIAFDRADGDHRQRKNRRRMTRTKTTHPTRKQPCLFLARAFWKEPQPIEMEVRDWPTREFVKILVRFPFESHRANRFDRTNIPPGVVSNDCPILVSAWACLYLWKNPPLCHEILQSFGRHLLNLDLSVVHLVRYPKRRHGPNP